MNHRKIKQPINQSINLSQLPTTAFLSELR